MRTRAEHLMWCKQNARDYLRGGDLANAVASMLSDLGKHPETEYLAQLAPLGMIAAAAHDAKGVSRFIEGFN
jgi:hypothetical protein